MKYYLYISDAKVDMLLAQIGDNEKRTISREGGFDFKVISRKVKTEYQQNTDRIERLESVLSFIRRFGSLGTVENPDEYIEDSLQMHSMFLSKGFGDPQDRAVYYTGRQGNTVIGLGGSIKHIIGADPTRGSYGYFSNVHPILLGLAEELGKRKSHVDPSIKLWAVASLENELTSNNTPTELLRFMAKRLLMEKKDGHRILGTPLYVTKED